MGSEEDFRFVVEDVVQEVRDNQPGWEDLPAPIDKQGAHFFLSQNSREPVTEPDEMIPLWKILHLAGADWTYGSEVWGGENDCMFLADDENWKRIASKTIQKANGLGCKVYLNTECGHSTYSVWMVAKSQGIAITPRGGIQCDPVTLQTPLEWVFAGGDGVYGPKSVVEAVACGKEAAISMDRYLQGQNLSADRSRDWEFRKPDITREVSRKRISMAKLPVEKRQTNFNEVSLGYLEAEALKEAERCVKCGVCSECYQCVKACLAKAIDHEMKPKTTTVQVGSIILAPGFKPFDPTSHDSYAYASHPNVVTSLEFERLLSASGPNQGHLIRPSDHKEPEKIAWLQCVGSRDINRCDHSYCSSVCCMYAAKQMVIAKEHIAHPLDTAVFYMDMRTHGKDFDRYYKRAQAEKDVRFVRARVHTVEPTSGDMLKLRYVAETGSLIEETFDMVVLSVGLSPLENAVELAGKLGITLNGHQFAQTSGLTPVSSNREGIYVCGAFQGPKDIPSPSWKLRLRLPRQRKIWLRPVGP